LNVLTKLAAGNTWPLKHPEKHYNTKLKASSGIFKISMP